MENTVAIHSIQLADTSYADLEQVGKALGNSRIVRLGEQDHGDAPTFKAKVYNSLKGRLLFRAN